MSRLRVKIKKLRPFFHRVTTLMKITRDSHYDVNCLDSMIEGAHNRNNSMIVKFVNNGEYNRDKNIAVIQFDRNWIKTAGFFALLNKTICGLYFSDRFGFLPFIDSWYGSVYGNNAKDQSDNIFDYYFEPVSNIEKAEVDRSYNVVYLSESNFNLLLKDSNSNWFSFSESHIEMMANVVKKYLKFNEETNNKLLNDYMAVVGDKKNILGIHFRGTDYSLNMNGHPVSLRPEDYYPIIDRVISVNNYDALFLATDDAIALDDFKKRYGGILINCEDVLRSKDSMSVAFIAASNGYDGKRAGYEVLKDSFILSKCNGLIAGLSQVSIFSAVLKRSRGDNFNLVEIIDKGTNQNKKEWIDEYEYLVK